MGTIFRPLYSRADSVKIYVNLKTSELMLACRCPGGWSFDVGQGWRQTAIAPEDWGWEFVDFFRGTINYTLESPVEDLNSSVWRPL